jgi:hypothetical protein
MKLAPGALVLFFVLLIRLPFLNQAIQGDDLYYLAAAQHAQIDPAHPHHARYVFLGTPIDMRGHPHPPGNAWILAALLGVSGDIREIPFHSAYILFSLLAAWSMWRLAGRFVPDRRLEATLLFCAVPAFVVNGNSLEADLPFLAFWMAGIASFVDRRLLLAFLFLAAAGLTAYQSVVAIPILAVYLWFYRRDDRISWLVLLTPAFAIAGYHLFEKLSSGDLPAQILAGHFDTYQLQTLTMKLKNAMALAGHLALMLSPLGLFALRPRRQPFLGAWMAIFFTAAIILFFAGSARYLLPLAAPFAMLVALQWSPRPALLWTCFALQLALGLGLAVVNYQHWAGYRSFVAQVFKQHQQERVWVNAEWGLRFYAESEGALALVRGQNLRPGDWLITSELAEKIPYSTGGAQAVLSAESNIASSLPLRLIGTGTGSAYSSTAYGLWPFGLSRAPLDTVRCYRLIERKPELSWLPMNAPQAESQIVSGVYALENNQWRWVSASSSFLLKPPAHPQKVVAEFFIPDQAPGRTVTLTLDGRPIAATTFPAPGKYQIESPPVDGSLVTLTIDKDFQAPGDNRRLGLILSAIGFRE